MIPKTGRRALLTCLFKYGFVPQLIGLVKADPTPPDIDLEFTDLTEATFAGYSRIDLTSVTLPEPTIDGSNNGDIISPVLTWTSGTVTSTEVIYGMFAVMALGSLGDYFWWFNRWTAPVTISMPGQEIKRKLNFKANNFTF